MKDKSLIIDKEVNIPVKSKELSGILTKPASGGPHPAIVLLHGSQRTGKEDPYLKFHAENLVQSGFAVLRYDGPGWGGQSSDKTGIETLEDREEEAVLIVKYLQSQPDIQSNKVGLWGISQGGWICQMAAAAYEGVAFIIPVSGPGVTPSEQEVYRVEAQSKEDGFDNDDVIRAVLMRRLLVDIILVKPVYQINNQSDADFLGNGPWNEFMKLVYQSYPIDPTLELKSTIEVLIGIKNKLWAKFLYLEQLLSMLESVPPDDWEIVKAQMRAVAEVDPADFLRKVHCPVLAIFGEFDTLVPVEKSVVLYKKYLKEAGNDNVTIKIFPAADHGIIVNNAFAPGYFETINAWLQMR